MKDPKTPSQISKLSLAKQTAQQLAALLRDCDEPVLAARADGFAQTVDLVRGEAAIAAVSA